EENLLWVVAPRIETVSRKLNSLLWLSPAQKSLYEQFHDVVIMDTTANMNQFQMMLFIVAIIDNNFRTRIVASCIIENETLDTFKWIYEKLLEETSVILTVIFTNTDYPTVTKYLTDTLYCTKESWAVPWIYEQFTGRIQSMQRVEFINMHIHKKVDHATSLYNLLINLKNYESQEEHLIKFEIQHNMLPFVGLPMLNSCFFSQVDDILKKFLTLIML
ncbi:22111_t:CDS:2, partial [Cetraspora pellucida]